MRSTIDTTTTLTIVTHEVNVACPEYKMIPLAFMETILIPDTLPKPTLYVLISQRSHAIKCLRNVSVCEEYATHGHCKAIKTCPLSHDLDTILDAEDAKKHRKRKREKADDDIVDAPSAPPLGATPATMTSSGRNHGHRAGFDAFMTGFVFACKYCECIIYSTSNDIDMAVQDDFPKGELVNLISLSGKPRPLPILKSQYTHPSPQHQAKLAKLFPPPSDQ